MDISGRLSNIIGVTAVNRRILLFKMQTLIISCVVTQDLPAVSHNVLFKGDTIFHAALILLSPFILLFLPLISLYPFLSKGNSWLIILTPAGNIHVSRQCWRFSNNENDLQLYKRMDQGPASIDNQSILFGPFFLSCIYNDL